ESLAVSPRFEHDFLTAAQIRIDQELGICAGKQQFRGVAAITARGAGAARRELARSERTSRLTSKVLVLVRIALEHALHAIATGRAGTQRSQSVDGHELVHVALRSRFAPGREPLAAPMRTRIARARAAQFTHLDLRETRVIEQHRRSATA